MTDTRDDRFDHLMKEVAQKLLGQPNKALSSKDEWRFGERGSLSVDLTQDVAFDHELGDGGGVLWLIHKQTGRKGPAAIEWLRQSGFAIEEKDREAPRTDPRRAPAARPAHAPVATRMVQQGARPDPRRDATVSRPAPQEPVRPKGSQRLVKAYDYVDETGKLQFQVCRFETVEPDGRVSKTFRQRMPDPSERDGWSWKLKDRVRIVPYRLPEVMEAIALGKTILIAEGEKDVDNLWEQGIPATCNPGGAGKWQPELVPYFAGADVICLPDNDPQKKNPQTGEPLFHDDGHGPGVPGRPILAGQDHAKLVADSLAPVAARVRVLELARHVPLPPKGDVSDWLAAGGTADLLWGLVPAAVEGSLYDPAEHFRAVNYQPRFSQWKSWKQIGASPRPHDWIIKNLVSVGELSMLAGASQAGKSFLTIDMLMAICRGTAFLGHKVVRPGGVIYQAGEGVAGLESRRIPAYMKVNGLTFNDDLPFELLGNPINLWEGDADTDALIEDILWKMRQMPVPLRMIVIDTLAKAMPGANENASQDVSRAMARCDRIRQATGANVMLVHHMNAAGEKTRGWSGLGGNVETTLIARKLDGQTDRDGRILRELEVEKLKDGTKSRPLRFVLRGVYLGKDEDGENVSSCVIKPPGETLPPGTAIEEYEAPGYTVQPMDVGF